MSTLFADRSFEMLWITHETPRSNHHGRVLGGYPKNGVRQLQSLNIDVAFGTDASPLNCLSSLTGLTLNRPTQSTPTTTTTIVPISASSNGLPHSLSEYNGGRNQIEVDELDRLPTALRRLEAHFLEWQPSMARFTSMLHLKLGNDEIDRHSLIVLACTLIHLEHFTFCGIETPLEEDTSLLFPNLTALCHQQQRLYESEIPFRRDTKWTRSLPFIEIPKLKTLTTTTLFSTHQAPMLVSKFPLLTDLTLVGDQETFLECSRPGALPASCTSLHFTDPQDYLGVPLQSLDALESLGSTSPSSVHTLVLDSNEQLNGTRPLKWVRTLEITTLLSYYAEY